MAAASEKIEIENVNTLGRVERVDKRKFIAMRDALLKVLPHKTPGLTVAEAKAALVPLLPQDLFPNGEKAGWWLRAAQLGLEAKGVIQGETTKVLPLKRLSTEKGEIA